MSATRERLHVPGVKKQRHCYALHIHVFPATKRCACCCCAPGVGLIAAGLAQNSTLLSLDLSDNHVSSVGAIDLAEALHSDKCKIGALLLSNNRIGTCMARPPRRAAQVTSVREPLRKQGVSVMSVIRHLTV